MGSGVGYEAGLGVDCRCERGDVREAAEDFRIVPDEVVVEAFEELVAILSAEGGQDSGNARIGKGVVEIGDACLDR